jgi:M3 family oligoendopeptidase
MKFEQYPFVVPKLEKIQKKFEILINDFESADSSFKQRTIINRIIKLLDKVDTQMTIIMVKYSIDTRVEKYQKAQDAIDEMGPLIHALYNRFQKALVNSKFRFELEKKLGKYLFKKTELSLKTFDEKIIKELQLENKLSSQYDKLLASAQIPFNGEILNLSQIGKYTQVLDRDTRKRSSKAVEKWFVENEKELASIYDQLVKLRHEMALKLGYKSFIELGYARLGRLDYDAEDVFNYRQQIHKSVVPISKRLVKRQKARIGIKNPKFYDLSLSFTTGNPTPKGNKDYLVNVALSMYQDMGEEIGFFFKKMVDENLLDLEAKPGKRGGGYMTYFAEYKMPFVFSNFNGTSADVDVLTHEIGHAFQGYMSRNIKIPEYRSPTMEAAEIHSMSMEFFAWPWMEQFFKEDKDKYLFSHLEGAINFLPYGVSVDEFQHYVYENPQATHEMRCQKWREIEKKYTPYKNYSGFPFYEKGTRWMRQSHIFTAPFYYIDYTLAQVVAFQFLSLMEENREKAWNTYVNVCKAGGKYPFTELLRKNKLKNPFKKGTIARTFKPVNEILNRFDDSKL